MSRNDLKQTIVHRSTQEKQLVERLISDRVEQNRSTISGETISAIKRGLLPPHSDAAFLLEELYAGNASLNQTVAGILYIMGAGINWKPNYNNALPLVEYAADMNRRNGNIARIDVDSDLYHDFTSYWKYVIDALEQYACEDAYFLKPNADVDVTKAQTFFEELTTHPSDLILSNAFDLILRNWNVLFNWEITYRTLSCMCVAGTVWRQNAAVRLELVEILTSMSRQWVIQDEEKAKENLISNAPRRMREIPMYNAHLVAPEEWVVLNPDDALHCRYAYAVAIRSNEYIDKKFGPAPLPFFIYFSDNPVQREIYDDCMDMATDTWPPLKAILVAHIDFPDNFQENDQLVNEVINESPNAAPFLIDDADKPYAHHPYGAMIIRHK